MSDSATDYQYQFVKDMMSGTDDGFQLYLVYRNYKGTKAQYLEECKEFQMEKLESQGSE